MNSIALPALDSTVEQIVAHLKDGHDAAVIAPPGCGTTTLLGRIRVELNGQNIETIALDMKTPATVNMSSDALRAICSKASEDSPRVIVIDHANSLSPPNFKSLIARIADATSANDAKCLWAGPLDARRIEREAGVRIHAVPRSHVSFPVLPRDELVAIYRIIAQAKSCTWGEAILFLLLDFCGTDLSLVNGVAEYLYGDWSNRLYDANIWDRIAAWLKDDPVVNRYRGQLEELSAPCKEYLALLRLGGKPPCPRMELHEEVDDSLRHLSLQGFLVPNLLPGFYQLRNLTIRLLVNEPFEPWNGFGPEFLLRRSTNERAGQLLQDIETMLRSVLLSVFHRIGAERVEAHLEGKQSDREFIPSRFNRALLEWAEGNGGPEAKTSLNEVIMKYRLAFKECNSVWVKVTRMMAEDIASDDGEPQPEYLRSVDYLTFAEMEGSLMTLTEDVFPEHAVDESAKGRMASRRRKQRIAKWPEYLSAIRHLRNQVAHLRNIDFQEMQNLAGIVEDMRNDLFDYAGWR